MSADSSTQTVAVADIVENKAESMQSTENASPKSPPSTDRPTKASYRKKVWCHLHQNQLVNFPWSTYETTPNFKGCKLAMNKLLQLEGFKKADNIEVNSYKAHEFIRVATLQAQKKLFVPCPQLKNGLLKQITAPSGASKAEIRYLTTQKGIAMCNEVIGFNADVQIDLMVVGSIAVSKTGHRIGTGRGFVDLKFGILTELKAVNENTTIVTLVHDSQVFEELPKELFQDYDLRVDFIITPTRIIDVPNRLPRPQGILWNILSNKKLNRMPLLRTLRKSSKKNRIDVTMKENKNQEPETGSSTSEIKRADPASEPVTKFRSFKQFSNKKPNIDFTLKVKNIEKTVRVRDLKNVLIERGIKPYYIIWKGYWGYAYLHYAKKPVVQHVEPIPPLIVDNVVKILQNLKIHPELESNLKVKVVEYVSSFESTDVTVV